MVGKLYQHCGLAIIMYPGNVDQDCADGRQMRFSGDQCGLLKVLITNQI